MTDWNEEGGNVTQSFDEWKLVERDLRAFLRLGLQFGAAEYARLWKEAGEEPGWDDGPEQVDTFEAKVDSLWEQDYAWMHLSGVLRDAVSAFEVYLEKAREEVLAHHGYSVVVPERSPSWKQLNTFFGQLGLAVYTDDVEGVVELRNFLTHRRGELRTEELRAQYQATHSDDVFPPLTIELTHDRVLAAMEMLAHSVREIDASAYEYSWGRIRVANLTP
jgi:hypothetical protein